MEFPAPLLKSIEQLRYQATPGELATQSGLPFAQVERELQQLAIAVGGHLQVSTSGDIVYKYPDNFQAILRQKFLWLQVQDWLGKIWRVVFYLIRIAFGLVLVGIAVIIALSLVLISLASIFSDSGGDGISFDGLNFDGCGEGLWIFSWDTTPHYDERRLEPDEKPRLSFLQSVFSFLFGDGNPNADLEQRRWRLVGQVIRKNRGAISAEQVAPYMEDVNPHSEDHILPVLVRFNGLPEVSDMGDIVYRFPELQAVSQKRKFKRVPAYLEEETWEFSLASPSQRAWIVGLAGFNLVGVGILGAVLKGASGGLLGLVSGAYGLMVLYALGFIAIPLGRWLWLSWNNGRIERRNERRRRQINLAQGADGERKQLFAQQFRSEQVIAADDVAYETDRDLLDQELERLGELPAGDDVNT